MKPQRRLALHRERLTDLDPRDLRGVHGGTHVRTDCNCLTHGYTCDACPIPTLPINDCPREILSPIIADTLPCA